MSEQGNYAVERLVSIRRNAPRGDKCGIRVLIKWKGYSEKDNTWEPLENLMDPPSAVAMLEELEETVKNNSVKKQMVRDALAIVYSRNPGIANPDPSKRKNRSPFKLPEADAHRAKRRYEKMKEALSVTNQSINSGSQSNLSDPLAVALANNNFSSKNQSALSPLIPKKINKTTEIAQDWEQNNKSNRRPTFNPPLICESISVSNPNTQLSTPPQVNGPMEEYYTGIQRKSKASDVYLVSKVRIDSRDKEVLSAELIDLMHEFRLTNEKEVLMRLCLQRLYQLENSFQNIADWTVRTLTKRIQEGHN